MEFDQEEKIIEHMRLNPHIWDKTHSDYTNNVRRYRTWKTLANQLNVPDQKLKNRWKSLRNSYRIQILKLIKMKNNGDAEDENCIKWRYFHNMNFLKKEMSSLIYPMIKPKPIIKTVRRYESDVENSMDETEDINFKTEYNNYEELETSEHYDVDTSIFSTAKQIYNSNKKNLNGNEIENEIQTQTEIDLFFRSMAKKVENSNLNDDEMNSFQIDILMAISKKLTEIRNNRE